MQPKQVRFSLGSSWGVEDRRNLDCLTRSLALSIVQVVVESRLGQKIKTSSEIFTTERYRNSFNLSIRDIPEVLAEAKKSMAGQIPMVGLGMCVEISLKTTDGETMVLETWYLEMADQCDSSARVTYTVYSRMSILLKSLIAVTRVTPAYKVASLQGSSTFVVCYRVYMGEPQGNCLGDGCQSVKVGQVGTPMGTLILSLAYRTQLALSPQKVPSKEATFMVKSDHFKPDMSPKHAQRPSHVAFHQENRSVVDELAAACQDCQDIHPATNPLQNPGHVFTKGEKKPLSKHVKDNDNSPTCASNRQASFSERRKVGAFVMDSRKDGPDPMDFLIPEAPFSCLLQLGNNTTADLNRNCSNNLFSSNNNHNAPVPNADDAISRSVASDADSQQSSSSASCADDFVLVELKPPFAMASNGSPSELGAFFRECQSAPTLASFSEQPTFADQISELTAQLAKFESSMPDFDDFVKSLHHDDTNK